MQNDADPKADAAPPSAIVGTWELLSTSWGFRTAALLSLGASQPGGLRKGDLFVLRTAGVEPGRSSLLFGTVRSRPSSRPQPRLRAPRRVMWLRGTRVRGPSRMR